MPDDLDLSATRLSAQGLYRIRYVGRPPDRACSSARRSASTATTGFTDNHFHNTGVRARAGVPKDVGRAKGALQARDDEFNCLSPYSDAPPDECAELKYIVAAGAELEGAFKPSSLRNISATGPYMHAGQFASLREVLQHYQRAPAAPVVEFMGSRT